MKRSGQLYKHINQLRYTYNATVPLTPALSSWQLGCRALLLHGFTGNMPHLFRLGCGFTFSHSLMVSVLDVALVPALRCKPPIVCGGSAGDLDQGTFLADYNPLCGSPASQRQAQNSQGILKYFFKKGNPREQREGDKQSLCNGRCR